MRLIFAGTPHIAVPALQTLIDRGHDIAAVVTQPDARGKRGTALHPSPIKEAARDHGLPVYTPQRASEPEFVAHMRALHAEAAAVVAYGQILTPELLDAVEHGWVNLHFSVLPQWRGAAPVQRSLMAGDDITGASTFVIEEGLDSGPVIGTLTERIRWDDTSGSLLERLATLGAPLLADSVAALVSGAAAPVAQPQDGITYAHKLTRQDAYVNWELPAHVVDRQIRGCTPSPGAWTTLPDGTTAKLAPVRPRTDVPATTPGRIFEHDRAVLVGTGTEPVELTEISPAGKRPMLAQEWWRGARLAEGAQLGEA
jgi:methionyl-tRNA formyltransferase